MPDRFDFALAIGGAAGQGIATPGDILARIFARRGLHLSTYNAYQSIVRGGHIFLTVRVANEPVQTHGDKLDLLMALNQDTMDRHLSLLTAGSVAIYNSDLVKPGEAATGVQLCGLPVAELTGEQRAGVVQNTVALGAVMHMMGMDFSILEDSLTQQFQRKGDAVVKQNVDVARAGYEHATKTVVPFPSPLPQGGKPLAVWAGNDAIAMGGAAAGVKFYAAYPMSPSSGILHWYATNGRNLGIMVRQVEDEIGVSNMVIGAAHTGVRAMCATSGGGFALMTEAVGAASIMEIPAVYINVMRGGPSTGLPTKTEQGDLWQALGASQGDFERFVVAPTDALDAFNTMPELFNLTDQCQCPGIVLSDLLISEGRFTVDPDAVDLFPEIDRGALITDGKANGNGYKRYEITESGVSPRAVPGTPGHQHTVATDEHDENSMLLSDEFTNPIKRRAMLEKRARKFKGIEKQIAAPELQGSADADVTLVGWGSTHMVIQDALALLEQRGIKTNHLPVKWLMPLHADAIEAALSKSKKVVIVENNYSGQFARFLRGETGIKADSHIRKYDGEPFAPHHIADGVAEILEKGTEIYIPTQEIMV